MAAGLIAAGVAAPIVGGLIGQQQSGRDRRREQERLQQAYDQWAGLQTPQYQEIGTLPLENYDNIAQFNPEIADLVQMQGSEMQGISLDPNLRAAQMAALDQLGQVSETGMTDVDRARLAQIQAQTDGQARGQREAIQQNMQARGMGGSGMELMAQLQGQQAAAQQANMGGLQTAADSQMAALDALYNRANLAGSMESQDWGRQAQTAQSQDAIARLNADFRRQHGQQRADTLNQAQLQNQALQGQQIDARNRNMMTNQVDRIQANNQTRGQGFQDQMARTAGMTGQLGNLAGMHGKNAAATQQMWGGIGQGVGQGTMAYAANQPKKDDTQFGG